MSAKSLKIDSLDLDLENPRITLASDQRDAMQKILNEQKGRLINLAESIAAKGFSPMDRCLVLRSNIRTGKFIVLEGNRRLLAAKSRCVAGIANINLFINNLRWSGRRDSNPRPSAPKADALPDCATPRCLQSPLKSVERKISFRL